MSEVELEKNEVFKAQANMVIAKEEKIKAMNIFEKLSAIANECGIVNKSLKISTGNYGYKAVSEADVLNAVKQLESKYHVFSYPSSRRVIESGILESEKFVNGGIVKTRQLWERIEVTYRFVNMDVPSEFIETTSYGDGIDTGDKSVGKGMTYADKYALMKAYKLVTGDDPDQTASPDGTPASTYGIRKSNADKLGEALVEAVQLGITLQQIAMWKKKDGSQVTATDVREAIALKKAQNDG